MNYVLEDENESINVISSIRVNPFARMESNSEKRNLSVKVSSTLEIVPLNAKNNIWNFVTLQVEMKGIHILKCFSLSLTSTQNSDRLLVANTETQKNNNSNIFQLVNFMYNKVWVPIARGNLSLTEQEYKNLFPDIFKLIPDKDVSKMKNKVEKLFDFVVTTPDLTALLYTEFYKGSQPIYVFYSAFIAFCKKYEVMKKFEMR